jgi:methylmalonyl-CoA/ethylmalonyl-CoA epimerase
MTDKIVEIGQVAITVADVKKSLVFYRDILGLDFLYSPSESLAFLQCGPTRIMLTRPQGVGEVGKNSIFYFKTSNIEKFYEDAIANGAEEKREPQLAADLGAHELWIGFLKDPDENVVGIMEEKRKERQAHLVG